MGWFGPNSGREIDPRDVADDESLDRGELVRRLRRIEIATGRVVEETLAGQYHSAFKGRGMEFDRVRLYMPGDDVRDIDWNVTARAGEAYVKENREERELSVLLAVDVSRSMRFGTGAQTKRALAAELAALLAFSAIWNNDKVGLALFSDRVEKLIVPRKGRKHALRVISEVLTYQPRSAGGDLGRALEAVGGMRMRRSVVFVLSDWLGPVPERAAGLLARRHDLAPIIVRDPAEENLPDLGLVPLRDMETGELAWADLSDPETRAELLARRADWERELDQALKKVRARPLKVICNEDYAARLTAYFRRRALRR